MIIRETLEQRLKDLDVDRNHVEHLLERGRAAIEQNEKQLKKIDLQITEIECHLRSLPQPDRE